MLKRLLLHPGLHFALVGTLLFFAHRVVRSEGDDASILVTRATVEALRDQHVERTGKTPTEEQEAQLIDAHVRAEALYREAIALGLHEGDAIVHRRLVQKMEFLVEDGAHVEPPSDAQLEEYLEANRHALVVPERLSLTHVFVGDRSELRADEILRKLRSGEAAADLGDPFLRGPEVVAKTPAQIAGLFGEAFAEKVSKSAPKRWHGPFESSYGLHLVRVHERVAARSPALEEVRQPVRAAWLREKREAAARERIEGIRQRYRVDIEPPTRNDADSAKQARR